MALDFLRSIVSNGTILLYAGIEKNSVTPVLRDMGVNRGYRILLPFGSLLVTLNKNGLRNKP